MTLFPQFFDLRARQFSLRSKLNSLFFGFINAVKLPFGADFSFKLIDGSEHIKQQPAGRVRRVDVLVNHLQFYFFSFQFHTVNARYSPKYFGLKKGIVAYTPIANHISVNARIIRANEHESHFVFDVLFNNSTKIQSEIHSTDSHGSNQVNFALLHLFGYQFAPRFKDIYETVSKSLYGFEHPTRYPPDYQIKPIRKINQKLVVKEWDRILRIILSLANKTTT